MISSDMSTDARALVIARLDAPMSLSIGPLAAGAGSR